MRLKPSITTSLGYFQGSYSLPGIVCQTGTVSCKDLDSELSIDEFNFHSNLAGRQHLTDGAKAGSGELHA